MKYPIRYRMYLPLVGLLCLAGCVLRTVACLTVRDAAGHFPSSNLPEISLWLMLAAVVVALTFPLLRRVPTVRPLLFTNPTAIASTGTVAFAEALLCAHLFPTLLGERLQGLPRTVLLLTLLCGMCGTVYYVLCLAVREQVSELRAWFGMAAVLFCALYAVYLYLDTTLPINAETKIASQLAFLAMAVYLLLDVRASLGRELYRMQATTAMIAAAFTAYAACPSLITRIAQGATVDHSIYETALTLCFFLFLCARIYGLIALPTDTPLLPKEDTASEAEAAAKDMPVTSDGEKTAATETDRPHDAILPTEESLAEATPTRMNTDITDFTEEQDA